MSYTLFFDHSAVNLNPDVIFAQISVGLSLDGVISGREQRKHSELWQLHLRF